MYCMYNINWVTIDTHGVSMKFGLRHIRYFIAVAEELHFRRAAEKLNISQPALSRAIQYLEQELDVVLFIRNNKNVHLTIAAEVLLEGSRVFINSIETTVENTKRANKGEVGLLKIGYTDFAISGVLPALLTSFKQKHADITINPSHGMTNSQLKQLQVETLDIGFVTGPINRPDMESCIIQYDPLVCIVPEEHPLATRQSINLSELANEPFVMGTLHEWEYFYYYLIPLCRQAGFVPNVVQEAFNSVGILGLVACNMGVTVLTRSTYNYSSSGLVAIPLEDVTEHVMTIAIWNANQHSGAKKLFIDYIREQSHELLL